MASSYNPDILFENADILAVNKPEGLPVIPERLPGRENLAAILQGKYTQKIFVVHRLDREVSGVILFAKNEDNHRYLNDQFAAHTVCKTYIALVHGIPSESAGVINQPLRQFGSGRMGVDAEKGKPSLTEYRVMERIGKNALLELQPKTGRRHQLRVHLYHIGHAIVGDPLYGDPAMRKLFPRLMLHASAISFNSNEGRLISIEAPFPLSFSDVLEACRIQ